MPPICGPIGRLQHRYGRPLFPTAPEMEALQFGLHMSSWRASSYLENSTFHINIHDFTALIINDLFIMMSFNKLHRQGSTILNDIGVCILLLEADNTSALILMSTLYHMHKYHITNLCNLFYQILLYFNTMFPSHFDGYNIAGFFNVEAHALSWPQNNPTY